MNGMFARSAESHTLRPPSDVRWSLAAVVRVAFVMAITTAYTLAFFTVWPRAWGVQLASWVQKPKGAVFDLLESAMAAVGLTDLSLTSVTGIYLVLLACLIPWIAMAAFRRGRPGVLGWRRPNRLAWRILLVGYIVAVPFLIWMVRSPVFADQYTRLMQRGLAGFAAFYLVNIFVEHFLFQGVMLAAFRPDHRWPERVEIYEDHAGFWRRIFQWFGLSQPTDGACGGQRVTRWLGLAPGCVPAVITSGMLFGLVHAGKDPREFVLSVPGGMLLGFIAYRTNSWLTPFMLHLSTAGTACALMMLLQSVGS